MRILNNLFDLFKIFIYSTGLKIYIFCNLFTKKTIVALGILSHIIKYFIFLITDKLFSITKDWILLVEVWDFIFIICISFFFYYFFVIELSIQLFGYSLLCYWFLFILVISCLIAAWQIEINFLWKVIAKDNWFSYEDWIEHYKNQTPLSFYDYLTNYKHKPLFWDMVVVTHISKLAIVKEILFTFFFFMSIFFIYMCSFRYDPRFIKFVTEYFYPVFNFYDNWRNPKREDFFYTLVWFWTRILKILKKKYGKKSEKVKLYKKYIDFSKRTKEAANLNRLVSFSLWKYPRRFTDSYFLWIAYQNDSIKRLAFRFEQPMKTARRFDPNWKLFFIRYIYSQFQYNENLYWKKYFSESWVFWKLMTRFKNDVNVVVKQSDDWTKSSFLWRNKFSQTSYEILLSENYFNNFIINSKPLFERYGSNRDLLTNRTDNNNIEWVHSRDTLRTIFTATPFHTDPFTLTELHKFWKKQRKSNWIKLSIYDKLIYTSEFLKIFGNDIENLNFLYLYDTFFKDVNVHVYESKIYENFAMQFKLSTKNKKLNKYKYRELTPSKYLLKRILTTTNFSFLYKYYIAWLNEIEKNLDIVLTVPYSEDLGMPVSEYLLQLEWSAKNIKTKITQDSYLLVLSNKLPSSSEFLITLKSLFGWTEPIQAGQPQPQPQPQTQPG
jgi:hypothetical protein